MAHAVINKSGEYNIIKANSLLKNNIDLNLEYKQINNLLFPACEKGHLEIVKLLIKKGANVNLYNNRLKRTLLHYACLYNHYEIVKFLIQKGADINCEDIHNDTPLHVACCKSDLNIVKLLIEKGASLYKKNLFGQTPLHISSFHSQIEITKYLIEMGAEINSIDNNMNTPLHNACIQIFAKESKLEVVKLLIENGANPNQINNNKYTARMIAIKMNNMDIVKYLKDKIKIIKIYKEEKCVICFEKILDGIAFNCGHMCCGNCSEKLKICHICRSYITNTYITNI
jgi:ankyrin repeat protein